MTTDKERAETWRQIADCYESLGEYPVSAADAREMADQLDPPKPEWPDGTIAWVTANTGKAILSQRINGRWDNYRHVTGATYPSYVDSVVTKVEPLRVLADDEIAVKRPPFIPSWRASSLLMRNGYDQSAAALESLIDALDAEAGDRA